MDWIALTFGAIALPWAVWRLISDHLTAQRRQAQQIAEIDRLISEALAMRSAKIYQFPGRSLRAKSD